LKRIEEQVRLLEARIEVFDENYSRSHDKSEQSIQSLYTSLKKQNELVQNNQTRMNASLEDLSGEVLKMRREVDEMTTRVARVENRINSAEGVLKTEVKGAKDSLQKESKQYQADVDKRVSQFQGDINKTLSDVEARLQKQIADSEARSKSNLNSLRGEVTNSLSSLEKLIRGLGSENTAAVRPPTAAGAGTTGPYRAGRPRRPRAP